MQHNHMNGHVLFHQAVVKTGMYQPSHETIGAYGSRLCLQYCSIKQPPKPLLSANPDRRRFDVQGTADTAFVLPHIHALLCCQSHRDHTYILHEV
jgi:hypothetical protein